MKNDDIVDVKLDYFIDSVSGDFIMKESDLILNVELGGFNLRMFDAYVLDNKIRLTGYCDKRKRFEVEDVNGIIYCVNNDVAKVIALLQDQIKPIKEAKHKLMDFIVIEGSVNGYESNKAYNNFMNELKRFKDDRTILEVNDVLF